MFGTFHNLTSFKSVKMMSNDKKWSLKDIFSEQMIIFFCFFVDVRSPIILKINFHENQQDISVLRP